jgi:hypothetical protein
MGPHTKIPFPSALGNLRQKLFEAAMLGRTKRPNSGQCRRKVFKVETIDFNELAVNPTAFRRPFSQDIANYLWRSLAAICETSTSSEAIDNKHWLTERCYFREVWIQVVP